jgi:hypothetical protein
MSADMQAGSLWNDLLKNGSVIHTNTYRRYAKRIRDRHFKLPVPHFRMPASSSSRRVHPSLPPVSSPSNLRFCQGTHPIWYPFVRKTFKFTAVRVTGNSPARRTRDRNLGGQGTECRHGLLDCSQVQPVAQKGFATTLSKKRRALEERTGAAKTSVPRKEKKVI